MTKRLRGSRVSVQSGHIVGRASKGTGPLELVKVTGLTTGGGGGASGGNSNGLPTATTAEQLAGTVDTVLSTPASVAALWAKAADVASATSVTLGDGGFFHVTGTTTITAFAFTTDAAGRPAWLKFDGILTLTHNATSLILPNNGGNITTAAGDTCAIVSEGSGNVRCVSYQRANGQALQSSVSPGAISLTSAHILVGNGSNVAADVAMSGDATIANTGALTIGNTKVTLAKIQNAAANSKLLGSGASGSGASYAELTLGTNLSMSGTTLNASNATPGTGGGLFSSILSAVPTASNTGYSNWVHQGTATATDTAVGIQLVDLTGSAGTVLRLRTKSVPSTPYSAIYLLAMNLSQGTANSGIGVGWYDGTKVHAQIVFWASTSAVNISVARYSDTSTFSAFETGKNLVGGAWPYIWMKLRDDGTNITFYYGADGVTWLPYYSVAKASGYLGSTGYTNLGLIILPQTSVAAGLTLMSYQETA